MDTAPLAEAYRGLPPASQAETLARLAHELTVVARDTYEPGSLDLRDPQRLRRLNEIQHRVTGHLRALLADDPHRYPDDVLVAIILDEDDPELAGQVAYAFRRSLPRPALA
jgi:hypothetical protein